LIGQLILELLVLTSVILYSLKSSEDLFLKIMKEIMAVFYFMLIVAYIILFFVLMKMIKLAYI